jgi:non-heme chloroperoxidase
MKHKLIATFLFVFFFTFSLIAQNATLEIPKGCKEAYFLTSDNVRIHYLIAGKGTALVLVPGWTMPAEIWEKQIEHFSKTNMVIAVDPRCQGKSEKTTEGLSFEREAQDISELVKHLRLTAYYLAGWSWAGPMICSYLKKFDEPALKGAIIVDAPVKITKSFHDLIINMTRVVLHDRINFTPVFAKSLFVQPQSDAYIEKLSKASLMTPTSAAINLLAVFLVYNDDEWLQTLKTTSKPILFFIAEGKDALYEELSKEVKLNYVIIPGGGHTSFVDKPAEFNKIVQDFIAKY